MFELLVELLFEIVINVVAEFGFGIIARTTRNGWWTFALILIGGALGWVSTAVLARPVLPWMGLRVLTIIIVPVVVAFIMSVWADRRRRHNKRPGLIDNWTDAYLFSLAFAIVRFVATW